MKFTVLTLFPDLIRSYVSQGVVGRAVDTGLVDVHAVDIRDFATDKYRTVDDLPFGGGAGMVLKPEPVAAAIESVGPVGHRVLLAPSGRPFSQEDAVGGRLLSLCSLCADGTRESAADSKILWTTPCRSVITSFRVAVGCTCGARRDPAVGARGTRELRIPEKESFAEGLLEHPHYLDQPNGAVGPCLMSC